MKPRKVPYYHFDSATNVLTLGQRKFEHLGVREPKNGELYLGVSADAWWGIDIKTVGLDETIYFPYVANREWCECGSCFANVLREIRH